MLPVHKRRVQPRWGMNAQMPDMLYVGHCCWATLNRTACAEVVCVASLAARRIGSALSVCCSAPVELALRLQLHMLHGVPCQCS
jgi:hypothetical protein